MKHSYDFSRFSLVKIGSQTLIKRIVHLTDLSGLPKFTK